MRTRSDTLAGAAVLLVGSAGWLEDVAEALATEREATVHRERALPIDEDGATLTAHDCLLADASLSDENGGELIEAVRRWSRSVPVVVCAANGSESLASDVVGAGATDYVTIPDDGSIQMAPVLNRLESAVGTARREARTRRRARQFDAVFRSSGTASWVLDEQGRLERVNDTALEMIGLDRESRGGGGPEEGSVDGAAPGGDALDGESLHGRSFWDLPWWLDSGQARADLRRVVEGVRRTGASDRVLTGLGTGDDRLVELTVVPVTTDDGSLVEILVEGEEITERVSLYRDLRRSEELHRITLNNMTDTVLVTDDEGRFTYICPNVHFIFGYTAEEIRDMGSIDDLLGADLFDREALDAEGVLKNIETTATDKAGREHTLLINVRTVSIQDGTLLFSCRDITKRKQREEALATLQDTARDFLYAETETEIAQQVVEDVPGVLDVDASAVTLFESDSNELVPAATSSAMDRLHGPMPTIGVDDDVIQSRCFVDDEARFFDDVHTSERLDNPASELRSAAYIPLGDHGLFVAGSPEVGAFTTVKRELADLLAATAEAALDRVQRERRLRAQERELKRQNADLTALNRINEMIREIDGDLVRAETRAEIERSVCDRLTDDERFAFAWIGVVDTVGEQLEARAWAGTGSEYLDSVSLTVDGENDEPAVRTAASGDVTVVPSVATDLRTEAWRTAALSRDFRSVVSVPLAYDDVRYGVLTVYADTENAFDGTVQAVLSELGETVASATSAIERKNALLTSAIKRLTFEVRDPSFVLSRLATTAACPVTYRGGVQQTATGSNVFVGVNATDVAAVEAAARDLVGVEGVQRINEEGSESVLRLDLSEPFVALDLATHGAILHAASAEPAETTIAVDIPETVDDTHVVQHVQATFADVGLRAKKRIDRSTAMDLYAQVLEDLTERQLEVVQTAYYAGFFESPRQRSGEEVAETLGISSTAFYRHVRTVQRKLFSNLFEDVGVSAAVSSGS